jgi:hypothetical protein
MQAQRLSLLLLYCCFTAALLHLEAEEEAPDALHAGTENCFTAALLLLYCCFTAAWIGRSAA